MLLTLQSDRDGIPPIRKYECDDHGKCRIREEIDSCLVVQHQLVRTDESITQFVYNTNYHHDIGKL